METITLNNGVTMPMLGFGVYQITDAAQCEQAVSDAIDVGYRLIDTAAAYTNEEAVGRAIARSGVARSELFVTTKLWVQDQGYDAARRAFDRSMARLGLDYLDLYLIHQPFGDYYGSWRAMEELLREGRVRAIGVCNFPNDRLVDLCLHVEVTPALNQIETHPLCQRITEHKVMEEYGVAHESWGSFAEGRGGMFHNETIAGIGARYGKSVAQVILRWLLQRGIVCIPKSVHRNRIEENFDVFDFTLSDDDMTRIAALDTGRSLFRGDDDAETARFLSTIRFPI
ncbi:aldo/keto reductase [Bifidobacterium aerophilum]|uniref:Aldo/keto reductase n=1 Tax=Bifidobacterium aerophilum TaxID=1798155 RepID=A0A6N9Z7D6_9BIFI|nr:aldo/keto reductase [Bifidobacterium aerophilum]NEG90274.1 aldo/keto reductase [Bifidobacterium aerophilum]